MKDNYMKPANDRRKLDRYIECILSGRPTKECLTELRGFDEFGNEVENKENDLDQRLDFLINKE